MGIEEYKVVRDHFEARLDLGYGFPCCACKHIDQKAHEEPCRSCDHNVNAVREDDPANNSSHQ